MHLCDFLISELPFREESVYLVYESPHHFNVILYPYTEISNEDLTGNIFEYYSVDKSTPQDDQFYLKTHNPPIRVKAEIMDLGDDYFVEIAVREI